MFTRLIFILTLGFICAGAPLPVSAGAEPAAALKAVLDAQVGKREATGRNDGPFVKKLLAFIGLPEGYPWCSAYVTWCLNQAGIKVPRYGKARSWFDAKHTIWTQGHRNLVTPKFGDLVGYRWTRQEIDHTGFVEIWGTGPTCQTNEGNTSGGKADRDGQGVYRNWRMKSQVYKIARYF